MIMKRPRETSRNVVRIEASRQHVARGAHQALQHAHQADWFGQTEAPARGVMAHGADRECLQIEQACLSAGARLCSLV